MSTKRNVKNKSLQAKNSKSNHFRQCKKAGIPSGEHPKMDLVLG